MEYIGALATQLATEIVIPKDEKGLTVDGAQSHCNRTVWRCHFSVAHCDKIVRAWLPALQGFCRRVEDTEGPPLVGVQSFTSTIELQP